MKNLKDKEKDLFVCKLIVKNFPSRVELYQMLDNFITKHNYIKDYKADNNDTSVQFRFNNPDLVFEFAKFLNLEKFKNPLYKNVKTNVLIDTKNKKENSSLQKINYSPEKISTIGSNDNINLNNNFNSNNINNVSIDSKKNNHNAPKLISKVNPLDDEMNYSPLMPRGRSILISTPYQDSQTRKEFKENLKNREKWLNKKGFINKYNPKDMRHYFELPTHIWQSPPALPIHKYQYRDINKDKWIAKKEFLFKNSHDLII